MGCPLPSPGNPASEPGQGPTQGHVTGAGIRTPGPQIKQLPRMEVVGQVIPVSDQGREGRDRRTRPRQRCLVCSSACMDPREGPLSASESL